MSGSIQLDLDRPIWAALTTKQAHLGQGGALVRRYDPEVAPFAALASETPAAYRALRELLLPEESATFLSVEAMVPGEGLQVTSAAVLHQMISMRNEAANNEEGEIVRLTYADEKDMLALVQRTKPGPFGKRTREMGNYVGMRDQGRLIAMAGERMCVDGYVEISAVCVDADYRGKGLAGRLVKVLRNEIERRGSTPFLHVLSDNVSAIRLYKSLGFELRRWFHLTRIGHAEPGAASL